MDFSVWPASNRTWAEVADTAVAAERDGWHGVWFADHFMPNVAGTVDADDPVLEVWSVLAGLAAVTTRLRLGPLVTSVTYRHPAVLAKIASTTDQISGGRVVLGIGAGWQVNEHEAYGLELGDGAVVGEESFVAGSYRNTAGFGVLHDGAVDTLARFIAEADAIVRESGLEWVILRLGGVLPDSLLTANPRLAELDAVLPEDGHVQTVAATDVATAFTNAVTTATNVFVANADIIKRTVFARALLPVSSVLSYGANFCIESLVLLAFIPIFPGAFCLSWALLLIPVYLVIAFLLMASIGLATSVLNVIYRDVSYLVTTALLILYWLTPLVYPLDVIPEPYRMLLQANPIAGILNSLRRAIMHGEAPSALGWAGMVLPTALAMVIGWRIYRHYEHMVLDYV